MNKLIKYQITYARPLNSLWNYWFLSKWLMNWNKREMSKWCLGHSPSHPLTVFPPNMLMSFVNTSTARGSCASSPPRGGGEVEVRMAARPPGEGEVEGEEPLSPVPNKVDHRLLSRILVILYIVGWLIMHLNIYLIYAENMFHLNDNQANNV